MTRQPKRKGVRTWLRSVVSPSNGRDHGEANGTSHGGSDVGSHVGSVGGSHDGSHDGSRGGSDGADAGEAHVEANGAPYVAPDGASHGGSHAAPHAVPGDAPDGVPIGLGVDGSSVPPAREYALALLEYLQTHPVLRERWVSSKALEFEFYPEFLEKSGWPPLPWLAVSKALKGVTKKRPKQLMLFRNGKRGRCCVVQFKVPRAARS